MRVVYTVVRERRSRSGPPAFESARHGRNLANEGCYFSVARIDDRQEREHVHAEEIAEHAPECNRQAVEAHGTR